jgi:hypothetical protein
VKDIDSPALPATPKPTARTSSASASASSSASAFVKPRAAQASAAVATELWIDKYAPQTEVITLMFALTRSCLSSFSSMIAGGSMHTRAQNQRCEGVAVHAVRCPQPYRRGFGRCVCAAAPNHASNHTAKALCFRLFCFGLFAISDAGATHGAAISTAQGTKPPALSVFVPDAPAESDAFAMWSSTAPAATADSERPTRFCQSDAGQWRSFCSSLHSCESHRLCFGAAQIRVLSKSMNFQIISW